MNNNQPISKFTSSGKITKEYIATLLPENPVIIEAGAHRGRDTVKMKKLWPQSTIYCFEPVTALFEQLTENTKNLPDIYRYPIALSNKVGTELMHVSGGRSDACSSLFQPNIDLMTSPDITFETVTPVPTTTLDQWAQEHSVSHVDFLWLDLQGAELIALQHATMILSTVKVIQVEVNLTARYHNAVEYQELKSWLESQGFVVDTEAFFKITWGDVLFVKHTNFQQS